MTDRPVKQCPSCGEWFTLRDIIESPSILPRGMAFEGDGLGYNPETLADSQQCTGQCMNIRDLYSCDKQCRYAPFRRFLLSTLSLPSQVRFLLP